MMRRFDLSKPIPDRIKFSKRTTGRTRAFLDTSTLPSATLPIQVSPHQTSRCGRSHATPGSPCHPIRRQSARRSRGDTAHGLQRTQRRNPRKPRTHAAGARGIRGCARHRQTIQRASIREKDRVVLADNRRCAGAKHHWLVIACDACDTIIDLDLTVKRRDPDALIRVALNDVRCPRCNGHGLTRIVGLSRYPSV